MLPLGVKAKGPSAPRLPLSKVLRKSATLMRAPMPTRYPRLGVVRDPELDRALAQTRALLEATQTRSAAAHVRALALRGAQALLEEAGPVGELRRRLMDEHGLIPARVDPRTIGKPPGEVDPEDPTPASDALRWVRGK